MSKKYYVGHDDGRAVCIHNKYARCYIQDFDNHDDELHLFTTSHRKEAEKVLERTKEVGWIGFKVKRLKK